MAVVYGRTAMHFVNYREAKFTGCLHIVALHEQYESTTATVWLNYKQLKEKVKRVRAGMLVRVSVFTEEKKEEL